MFDSLAEKLQEAFQKLRRSGTLREEDVDAALREVRLALLEADVNFRVVKDFVARVKERAIGGDILAGLNPAQQVIKIVHEELIEVLGGDEPQGAKLAFAPRPPSIVMLCGLQGAGKTTLAGKLAVYLRKQNKNPVLAACDLQRPAAITQLQVVGEQAKTPVFTLPGAPDPVRVAQEAVEYAKTNLHDVLILDTAGRLQIDAALMDELKAMKAATQPAEILLVLDAMTGQEAVNVAREFNDALDVGGFVLTKIDGDTRGGAAISIRAVVGKPIKLVGVGEKLDALEPFHPDRMAGRILGMGDVLTLIEKAQVALDEKQAEAMEKKLRAGKFDFEDFLSQMQQIKRLGPLDQILKMLPGMGAAMKDMPAIDPKQLAHVEAIIQSMTRQERRNPDLLNGSRRKRIAVGSGTTVQEVNKLVSQYEQMRQMMRGLASGKMPGMPGMGGGGPGRLAPAALASKKKKGKGGGGNNRFRLPFGRG